VDTGKGESIGNQIEMCRQHIFSKFPNAKDENITVFEDEGFSGKSIERPQFKKMLAELKRKAFDCLVCYRLDRISRNVGDFASIIEELNSRDISFISIKESFDTTTPMGKAMLYIASVFAQLERETIAERVRDNMVMLARTGRWLGGITSLGYVSDKAQDIVIDGKIKTSCLLKENPDEIAIVDLVFNTFLELRSTTAVNRVLIKQGIKTRSGQIYSPRGIKSILQNPVYCTADSDALKYFRANNADVCFDEKDCGDRGIITYNKRDYKKKSAPRLSMDNWIVAIGKHKGRIPGEKWVAVQNILEANKPDGIKPALMRNDYSLLSGLIHCEKCGNRMFSKPYSGKNPSGAFSYICHHKQRGGSALCDCPNLEGLQTDDIVCDYLKDYLKPTSGLCLHLEKLKRNLSDNPVENPLAAIEAKIKKVAAEMDNLVATLGSTELVPALLVRVNERMSELDGELKILLQEKARLEGEQDGLRDSEKQVEVLFELLSSFKNNFNNLTVQDKRALIKILVRKISWDGKDLHIFIDGG